MDCLDFPKAIATLEEKRGDLIKSYTTAKNKLINLLEENAKNVHEITEKMDKVFEEQGTAVVNHAKQWLLENPDNPNHGKAAETIQTFQATMIRAQNKETMRKLAAPEQQDAISRATKDNKRTVLEQLMLRATVNTLSECGIKLPSNAEQVFEECYDEEVAKGNLSQNKTQRAEILSSMRIVCSDIRQIDAEIEANKQRLAEVEKRETAPTPSPQYDVPKLQ